ncbi:MAG: 4Fe-4S binding protein [Chloroflexota bacterium]
MSQTTARTPRPALGAIRRPRRGLAALRGVQGFRRATQLAVTLVVLAVVVERTLAVAGGAAGGTVTTGEALCPFGGIETIGTFLATGSFVSHVHVSNVILGLAVLLVAFFARGAFCGWLCPLGFIQDLVAGFSHLVQRRIPPVRRAVRTLERRASRLAVLDRPLRLLKYAVLAWAVLGAAAFGVMVFRDVDPWNALLEIGSATVGIGLVVLVLVIVASFFVERAWCRYACPLGAATGIVSRFSPIRLERVEAACSSCGVCTTACPMGLPVATATVITSQDCIGCLECVEACPRSGALELRAGLPVLPTISFLPRRSADVTSVHIDS